MTDRSTQTKVFFAEDKDKALALKDVVSGILERFMINDRVFYRVIWWGKPFDEL